MLVEIGEDGLAVRWATTFLSDAMMHLGRKELEFEPIVSPTDQLKEPLLKLTSRPTGLRWVWNDWVALDLSFFLDEQPSHTARLEDLHGNFYRWERRDWDYLEIVPIDGRRRIGPTNIVRAPWGVAAQLRFSEDEAGIEVSSASRLEVFAQLVKAYDRGTYRSIGNAKPLLNGECYFGFSDYRSFTRGAVAVFRKTGRSKQLIDYRNYHVNLHTRVPSDHRERRIIADAIGAFFENDYPTARWLDAMPNTSKSRLQQIHRLAIDEYEFSKADTFAWLKSHTTGVYRTLVLSQCINSMPESPKKLFEALNKETLENFLERKWQLKSALSHIHNAEDRLKLIRRAAEAHP